MGTDVDETEEKLPSPCDIKVHSVMCIELMKLVSRVDKIFPEARPRCSSGIQSLCLLISAIEKAKLLIQDCSESSKLYVALTGNTILSRCKKTKSLLEQCLSQIQNMVPVMLASKISQIIEQLRGVNFNLDPSEEDAGKAVRSLLEGYGTGKRSKDEFTNECIQITTFKLQITSPKSLLYERRSIKRLLSKIGDGNNKQQKKQILLFMLDLLNKYGEGGYGVVYKGTLINGTEVAVKKLLNNLGQAEKEFRVEVEAIGHVRHKNLVRLLGYCIEGTHRMLVYEYVDNGNLEQWLHGDTQERGVLTWEARMKVLLGIAKAELSMFNQKQTSQRSYFNYALMNEIRNECQPYVSHIEIVDIDGNCGFRTVAISLGFGEDYWLQIRVELRQELLSRLKDYTTIFGDNDLYALNLSLDFYESPAVGRYWMIMPDTDFLIPNKYGVIVHFLSKQGSSTCFPLWGGPEHYPNHRAIAIALVYGNHYVKVDLQEGYPMPIVLPLWRIHRSPYSAGWESLYSARLNAYIPPNRPNNNCNIDIVDIPDNS